MSVYEWSTTASSNASADGNINWQENQNPSTVNNSARAMMSALKSFQLDLSGLALGGSGDVFTLSPAQALPSLTNAIVGFISDRANTGAVTLSVSGLTAKPLRNISGADLTAGRVKTGGFYLAAYDTSSAEWLLIGPGDLVNADLPSMANNTVKANISGSGAVPGDVTIDNLIAAASANSVALAKLPTQSDGTVLANITGGVAVPAAVPLLDIISEILTTRGDILRYGETGPERLALGSNGQFLGSDGTDTVMRQVPIPKLTSGVIIHQEVEVTTTSAVACPALIPMDNTIPQSTEGTQVLSLNITPVSASSTLVVRVNFHASRTGAEPYVIAALFRDSGADAIATTKSGLNAGGTSVVTHISHRWRIAAGSTAATTFKLRIGGQVGSLSFNGNSSGTVEFGGTSIASMTIEEREAV